MKRSRTRPAEGILIEVPEGSAKRAGVIEWLRNVPVIPEQPKQPISFRVDPDVLDFFKAEGPRYQTRMNAVLRAYMTAHTGEEQ